MHYIPIERRRWTLNILFSRGSNKRKCETSCLSEQNLFVVGEMDQVMLMGWNCSHMVCKIGCHCELMDGTAWLQLSDGFQQSDGRVLYEVKLLLVLEFCKYSSRWKIDLMICCVCNVHVELYRVACSIYSRAHKLFGHSRAFILKIMIYVKRIIFSNDCISKRLKDRKLKLFSWYSSNNAR